MGKPVRSRIPQGTVYRNERDGKMRQGQKVLAFLLAFTLIAGACGSDAAEEAAPSATTAASAAATTVASSATAGLDELNVAYFLEWPTANQVAQVEETYDAALGIKVN